MDNLARAEATYDAVNRHDLVAFRLRAAGDDAVVAQFTTTGTIPATGATMRVDTCEVIRSGGDGLVVGTDIYDDRRTMTEQLGGG